MIENSMQVNRTHEEVQLKQLYNIMNLISLAVKKMISSSDNRLIQWISMPHTICEGNY